MRHTPLAPFGVEVRGARVSDLGAAEADDLRRLLADHGVAVFRRQAVDDDGFLTFLRRLGRPVFTVGETPVPGHPELNVVTNVGRSRPPRSVFHVDTSYVAHPPAYTALRAVAVPEHGGETLFTDQYRAYDTLPGDLRELLAGRTIRHVVTGVDPGELQEHAADHPVFRPHPVSGRTALYLTTPERCAAVSGLDDATARRVVDLLYAHSIDERHAYRHRWRGGDVVVWDNGCVLHRADHSGVRGDRTLHRGMVDGYAAR